MSTPRCLRIAIETCRPRKSSNLPLRVRSAQSQTQHLRPFSSGVPRCADPKDITAGFPMPEVGSRNIQGVVGEEQANAQQTEPNGPAKKEKVKPQADKSTAPIKSSKISPSFSQPSVPSSAPAPDSKLKIAQGILEGAEQVGPHTRKQTSASPQPSSTETPTASTTQYRPMVVPNEDLDSLDPAKVNVPPNVLAAFRSAIRHPPTHGIPVASLQLRSYNVRNLEFFADFAVRAAYWLNLPLSGPVPLPKKIERWTVTKSPFIFKKSKENFERITRRRLLTVYDGDPSVVEVWLAFLRKWQFYGVGMKANVWSFEGLDVAKSMDKQFETLEKELDEKLKLFGFNQAAAGNRDLVRMMLKQGVRAPGVGGTDVRDKSKIQEPSTEGDVI